MNWKDRRKWLRKCCEGVLNEKDKEEGRNCINNDKEIGWG